MEALSEAADKEQSAQEVYEGELIEMASILPASEQNSKRGTVKPKPASKLKAEKLQSIESFTEDINQQPYVIMEGEITFDIKALPKARKMLSRYQSLSDFIQNASLSDKLVIARFLNTGEWEETPLNLAKLDDRTVRNWGDILLHPYVGLDTRGLTRVDVGIGANIDLIKVEKAIDRTLTESYLDPVYQGSKMKAGRMWQKMQELFGRGDLTAPAGTRDQTELQAIHDVRSVRSKVADESRSNALTLDPDDPRVDIWERDPGRADIIGIDTPRKSINKNSRKLSRKPGRGGDELTQVRGLH